MKNIFKLALFFCFVFNAISGIAQNKVSYVYDSAGNRVSRTIILTRAINPDEDYFLRESAKDWTVKIYPSETMVKIAVENYNLEYPIRYNLYNTQGAVLLSDTATEPLITLDMTTYSTGTYVLNINIGKHSSNWKFIKK